MTPTRHLGEKQLALDRIVDDALLRMPVPGAAVAVVAGGQTFLRTHGVTRAGGHDPVTASTLFEGASNAKAFTALGIGCLVHAGLLQWDDPVARFIADFRLSDEWVGRNVTLRDLLCNRVGLEGSLPLEEGLNPSLGARELTHRMRHLRFAMSFRSGFQYSNLNFILAHQVVCEIGGSLDAVLRAEVLDRMAWQDSHFDCLRFHGAVDRAFAHYGRGEHAAEREAVFPNEAGAGNVYLSIRDAAAWLRWQLQAHGREETGGRGLAAIVREQHRPHVPLQGSAVIPSLMSPFAEHASYGLGWALSSTCGTRLVMHTGAMPGFRSFIALAPVAGVGVAVLTNSSQPVHTTLGHALIEALLGQPGRDWVAVRRDLATAVSPPAPEPMTEPALHSLCGSYFQPAAGALDIAQRDGRCELHLRDAMFWDGVLRADLDGTVKLFFDHPGAADILGAVRGLRLTRAEGVDRLLLPSFGEFDRVG